MKKYWKYSKEQLRDVFSTTEQGLSEMQVKKIRETCGENILEEGKRPGLLRVFLSQFADLLIVILLIAALISMCSGNVESTIVIAVVLVMNAVLGTVQHQKAEKSLDSLKNLSAPCAKVIREGKKKEILRGNWFLEILWNWKLATWLWQMEGFWIIIPCRSMRVR